MKTSSIVLCGVGGQGILLAARIVGKAAEISGLDVMANETHGMAQRGGSVRAFVRFGSHVGSPLVREGTADAIAALEPVEALRWAHYLSPGALAVVNLHPIVPVTVSSGKASYPPDVAARLEKVFPRLAVCDCDAEAVRMGNPKLSNTILVGMLSRALDFDAAVWHAAIGQCVKPQFAAANAAAFDFGRGLAL